MNGVNFVVDQRGRKKAVVIDLEQCESLWEDIHDIMVVNRADTSPVSH
jgi:hypothetical protein